MTSYSDVSLMIDGAWTKGANGRTIPVINPATEEVIGQVAHADPARIEELSRAGVPLELVAGWSHAATIAALVGVCKRFKPDVLVAHGFSEHLWGRYAGLWAGVPRLIQVEHNTRERYGWWRLRQCSVPHWASARNASCRTCSPGSSSSPRSNTGSAIWWP